MGRTKDVGLVVPVLSNFKGLTELIMSVDYPIRPYIIDNWKDNIGVARGWNAGIKQGWDQEVLIICNDDVTLYNGTIEKLVESLDEVDLVSGVAHDDDERGLQYEGFPDFSCFAIKPIDFVNKFGWFDENFKPAYFEDNDMYRRIQLAGGKTAINLGARIHHEGSVTQFKGKGHGSEDRVVSHHQFRLNRAYYESKWGGPHLEEKYSTPFNRPNMTIKDWE